MKLNTIGEKTENKTARSRTMPFIFGTEACEKVATIGFNVNMISYLTTQLHMPLTKAAKLLTNFGGTSCLTALLGAFVADSFAGRFWTITVASLIYQIGMTCLTISAIVPSLRPPPCNTNGTCEEADPLQLTVLYMCLLLGAIGSGGIRPCVVMFGADQLDETYPKQSSKIWRYFNWYFFVMGTSIIVAVTVIVYVQDNVGWGWGLGIPTAAMFLSIVAFVTGYPFYRKLDPAGSPFTRLLQVSVAAWRNRKIRHVPDPKALYQNEQLDASISVSGKLQHTKHMSFVDKAAIVKEEQLRSGQSPNLWKLSTIHRVEELKSVIRMVPIWVAGIILATAYSQQLTFSLEQAKSMDRHLGKSFQIPAGSMSFFTMVSMLGTIVLYDRILVPITKTFTGLERGISFLQRMGIGFILSILATLISGFVEVKRKKVALATGLIHYHNQTPVSVFWLAPQYCFHGIAEAFASIGQLEFFYDQAPESMRSTAAGLFWTSISLGNYVSTLLVSVVHKTSAHSDGTNWLPDHNLNEGKLEYFYWLITLLQVINLLYYLYCAKIYTFKPIQNQQVHNDVDGVELANIA